ncbi:cyclic nucleotide-binding domain-containing protein [Psychrilyobacter atlanticus]|uniref:cyclic nucleotide-binding domain-containing protein n=1 Tax=Psychrilyobacter atlanticus TaxID=271091 RepID=UPI000425636F|nr:cyclic nucleotide-binding domain-containing protein [Psychrilyobacter atlanticus]
MSKKELRNKVIELLSKTSFFGGIAREDIDFFIEKLIERSYSAGENIFEEGETTEDSYLLLEGEVKAVVGGRTADKFYPGMFFGIIAQVGIPKHLATAIADTDIILVVIPKTTLSLLEKQKPELYGKIILKMWKDTSNC